MPNTPASKKASVVRMPASKKAGVSRILGPKRTGISRIRGPKRAGIGRIPPEILSKIFVHCLPVDQLFTGSQKTQQLLSGVCRLWRELALATPALWALLKITCGPNVLHPPLHAIHTHLQRSGAYPLSFSLRGFGSPPFDSPNPNLSIVFTALAADHHRWCNVYIHLVEMEPDILDLITLGDAPLLQRMSYQAYSPHESLPIPLRMLERCPRLASFNWNSLGSPLEMPLSNTHLTSLSLRTNLSITECVALLRLSPRLSSAEFHYIDSPDLSTTPRLTHPTLCTLAIAGAHFNALLDALTLPALLDLNLTNRYLLVPPPNEWDTTLSAFLTRSKPTLHELSIAMILTQDLEPALLRILALTPQLRSLSLTGDPDSAPLTAVLTRALHPLPPPGAPLCPHLQKLTLSGISDCPDGLCGAMLRARSGAQAHANGVVCLEQFDITFKGQPHDRDQADMKELCEEGMRTRVNFLP